MHPESSPPPAPDGSSLSDRTGRSRRRLIGRGLLLAMLAATAGMWIYAFGPWARHPPPGKLDDPSFAEAAEPICAGTAEKLDLLPQAHTTPTPEERAEVLDRTNDLYREMIGTLRAQAPRDGEDARRVGEWLDDWGTYVGDRAELADKLRTGRDARITETAKDGTHISRAIDFFAETANAMPSCATPDDVS